MVRSLTLALTEHPKVQGLSLCASVRAGKAPNYEPVTGGDGTSHEFGGVKYRRNALIWYTPKRRSQDSGNNLIGRDEMRHRGPGSTVLSGVIRAWQDTRPGRGPYNGMKQVSCRGIPR